MTPPSESNRNDQFGAEQRALEMEYRHLRSEIETSIRNQVRVLGYGGAVLSLLVALGALQRSPLLLILLPLLAFIFFALWNVEQTRMMRAGDYLAYIEDRFNENTFGGAVTFWENWLRYRADHPERTDIYQLHIYTQRAMLIVFILIIAGGSVALFLLPSDQLPLPNGIRLLFAGFYAGLTGLSLFLLSGAIKHGDIRDSIKACKKNLDDRYS